MLVESGHTQSPSVGSVGLKSLPPPVASHTWIQEAAQRVPPHSEPPQESQLNTTSFPSLDCPWLLQVRQPGAAGTLHHASSAAASQQRNHIVALDRQAPHTFLNMEDDSLDECLKSTRSPASLTQTSESPGDDAGIPFADLIHRLLEAPVTKQDAKFVPVFLCLYRKFSSPAQVFLAFISHFTRIENSDAPQLIKIGEHLRHLHVLALWTRDYPGDFAHPSLKRDVSAFVSRIAKKRAFAYAARNIMTHLELAVQDEDAEWNRFECLDALPETFSSINSQSDATTSSSATQKSSDEESFVSAKQTSSKENSDDMPGRPKAASISSSFVKSFNASSQPAAEVKRRQQARQEAQQIIWTSRLRLSKTQWRRFMELPDLDVARELTQLDWTLFSAIRPRDLVLHASLSSHARKSSSNADHVQRMVEHFNRVCCFVSSLILLRDKPKHRARMLAKWMTVAWKVRQLNNYNTLGAIVAGTNSTAVHRLTSTWELVPESTRKQYMRLTMLMGTVRSHSAYRMAWENSFSERIPFLPVYQKDLVTADSGNQTFIGPHREKINWKKFEIMGEVIVSVQKSQDQPYKLPKCGEFTRMMLDTVITEDEEVSGTRHIARPISLSARGQPMSRIFKLLDMWIHADHCDKLSTRIWQKNSMSEACSWNRTTRRKHLGKDSTGSDDEKRQYDMTMETSCRQKTTGKLMPVSPPPLLLCRICALLAPRIHYRRRLEGNRPAPPKVDEHFFQIGKGVSAVNTAILLSSH